MDLTPTKELVALAAFCWGILAAVMLYAASLNDEGREPEDTDWTRNTETLIQATEGIEDLPQLRPVERSDEDDE